MTLSCHRTLEKARADTDMVFALAGNPNVGKSSVFNHLTGLGVITANYPGKTVEISVGTTSLNGQRIAIVDLPGTYALGGVSEDQWVARQTVLEGKPNAIIMVVDATNLARNLYMVLQFLDLGFPLVLALNIVDEAEREGIHTDADALASLLGVPVVPTVAVSGRGLDEVIRKAIDITHSKTPHQPWPRYGRDVAEAVESLAESIASTGEPLPYGLPPRAVAVLLLEGDQEFVERVGSMSSGPKILEWAQGAAVAIEGGHDEPAPLRIARERHGLAGSLASQVQTMEKRPTTLTERLWHYTTSPVTGMIILLAVLGIVFATLFYVGEALSRLVNGFWSIVVAPPVHALVEGTLGDGILGKTVLWGADAGVQAALSVGIPYILTFYLILALLEDSGYLNSAAFLTDRVMHRIGLHSRAVIPLIAGAGCSVPAVIGTRVLTSVRERVIASTLIVLIPCSARTAVILGAVALYVGWQSALAVYLIVFGVVALAGMGLNRIMPGQSEGLVMELFPFRVPSPTSVVKKTWNRFQEFLFVATPIMLVGSMALGALYESGYVWYLTGPLAPVVEGWLGLPSVAGLALIFAILRKELALQLLVALAVVQFGRGADNLLQFMSGSQIVTYAVVNTLYIPCIATFAVLGHELGWRRTALIAAFTIVLATILGGLVHRGLWLLGWGW